MKKSLILAICIVLTGLVEVAGFEALDAYNDGLRLFWGIPLVAVIALISASATENEALVKYVAAAAGVIVGALVGIIIGLMFFEGIFGASIGLIALSSYVACALR